MKLRAFLLLATTAFVLNGCVSNSTHPGFAEAHPKIRKIAIIPPEIVAGDLTTVADGEDSKRQFVRNEERESIYRQSLIGDQSLLFGSKGYQIDTRLVALSDQGNPGFNKDYLAFINDYKSNFLSTTSGSYTAGSTALPITAGGKRQFEVSMQKALRSLENYTDADAFVYVRFGRLSRDPTSIVTHVLTTALFGFMFVDDRATLEISCFERGTGRLLWRDGFQTYQDYFIHFKRLVDEFPNAAGNTAPAK